MMISAFHWSIRKVGDLFISLRALFIFFFYLFFIFFKFITFGHSEDSRDSGYSEFSDSGTEFQDSMFSEPPLWASDIFPRRIRCSKCRNTHFMITSRLRLTKILNNALKKNTLSAAYQVRRELYIQHVSRKLSEWKFLKALSVWWLTYTK